MLGKITGAMAACFATCALAMMPPALANDAETQATHSDRGVFYLTLRDRLEGDERDAFYGDERSHLKAGRCHIGQTSLDFLSSAAEVAPFRIPEEILRVDAVQEAEIADVIDEVHENSGGEALLYVHGFYINFDKGCRRATVFKENSGLDNQFLWFSWPSDGALLNYARDEVDLYWSAPDLAEVIAEMQARFGSGKVHLAGHSLGGRGLALALYEVASTNPDLRVGEVILLAPDIDFEIFEKILPRIRPLARRITVYTSSADKALAVSEQLHGYPRLGQSGNDVSILKGVEVIDTSGLKTMSANGHLYHIYNIEVGADVDQLVNGGKPAAERTNLRHMGNNLWRLIPEQ